MAHRNAIEVPQGGYPFPRGLRQSDTMDSLGETETPPPLPLKSIKAARRESRLGFRNIFGRSSKLKDEDDFGSSKMEPRYGGIRASIAEMSHWPYEKQAKSEVQLPITHEALEPTVEVLEPAPEPRRPSNGAWKRKPTVPAPKQVKPPVPTASMPPLFKAYQQSLKHGTLPAVTMSTEVILRLNEKRNAANPASSSVRTGEDTNNLTVDWDRLRRRGRAGSLAAGNLQWTSKIYVLSTTGHLLQYPGDGAFDRLPERAIRLGKSSAAFVTDVIPGRHWVLQITPDTTVENQSSAESRSLFSKLQFRTQEKQPIPDLLMVLESVEDMEDWMACLRTEIEKLGGRRSLPETGAPETDDAGADLQKRPSQRRTVVLSIPTSRFSRRIAVSPTFPWQQEQEPRASDCSDGTTQDPAFDDVSTTNSVASQDGRQLDNLRDSSHRLSLLSSGQRTVVTSTTSSPANSPIIDIFPYSPEAYVKSNLRDSSVTPEARPRPNAGLIVNRRMSLQTMGPFLGDTSVEDSAEIRPTSSSGGPTSRGDGTLSPLASHPTPNFSVPHTSTRRFSYVKAPLSEQEPSASSPQEPSPPMIPRSVFRKPSNIHTGRPLSTVEDQPSPKENMPERPITSHHIQAGPSTPPPMVPRLPRERLMSVPDVPSIPKRDPTPTRRMSAMPKVTSSRSGPQSGPSNISIASELRNHVVGTSGSREVNSGGVSASSSPQASPPPLHIPVSSWSEKARRRRSSLDPGESSLGLSFALSRAAKRASIGSTLSDRSASGDVRTTEHKESLPKRAPPPTAPLPPIPSRPTTATKQVITTVLVRKGSMSQVVVPEGPPPAPPPTCALPPVPVPQPAMS